MMAWEYFDSFPVPLPVGRSYTNVTSLGFQKDGRYLCTGSEDRTIQVWDLRSPQYCRSFAIGATINSVFLRHDRDELISGDQNGLVKFWELNGTKGPVYTVQPSSKDSHIGTLGSALENAGHHESSHTNHAHPYRYSEGMVPIQDVDIHLCVGSQWQCCNETVHGSVHGQSRPQQRDGMHVRCTTTTTTSRRCGDRRPWTRAHNHVSSACRKARRVLLARQDCTRLSALGHNGLVRRGQTMGHDDVATHSNTPTSTIATYYHAKCHRQQQQWVESVQYFQ
jgi:hypothetical protein